MLLPLPDISYFSSRTGILVMYMPSQGKPLIQIPPPALLYKVIVVRLEVSIESFPNYIKSKKNWKHVQTTLQESTPPSRPGEKSSLMVDPKLQELFLTVFESSSRRAAAFR